jgi:hypothetical protein
MLSGDKEDSYAGEDQHPRNIDSEKSEDPQSLVKEFDRCKCQVEYILP